MLAMYTNSKHDNWDEWIPFVTFAYNSTVQESLKETPHFLLYGQDPRLPMDVSLGLPTDDEKSAVEYKHDLLFQLAEARRISRKNLSKAQEKQKNRYDTLHREANFLDGDLVWLKIEKKLKGKTFKLSLKWEGPYRIISTPSELTRAIRAVYNPRKTKVVHVSKLKDY